MATIKELYETLGALVDDFSGRANLSTLDDKIVREVERMIADEREACAKVVESWLDGPLLARKIMLEDIAASIRGRSQQ